MGMTDRHIRARIKAYKNKHYLSVLIRGVLVGLGLILTVFLAVNLLEFLFRFGYLLRGFLLFVFLGAVVYVLYRYIGNPLINLMNGGKGMSEEEAAKRIGQFFPAISDKLLNLLQLEQTATENSLAKASISQRSAFLKDFEFSTAISSSNNIPYLKYTLVPLAILLLILMVQPSFIEANTKRILYFNEDFVAEAPFDFILENEHLKGFRNEDFTITLSMDGNSVPAIAYLLDRERRIKLLPDGDGNFSYTLEKLQYDKQFQFEAAGFFSKTYEIKVVDRPDLKSFDVALTYPSYLGRKNDRFTNTGNLQIPEGTKVTWLFNTLATDSVAITFNGERPVEEILRDGDDIFSLERTLSESTDYDIKMFNEHGSNKDAVRYQVFVDKDAYPEIQLEQYRDTTLFSFIAFRGTVQDDYGLSRLKLFYRLVGKEDTFSELPIDISAQPNQRFYYQWDFDSILYNEGASLEYFLRVWDNDGVNGAKSSKTATYTFRIPGEEEINEEMDRMSEKAEKDIERTLKKARDLEQKLETAEERMKAKQELSWQDEQLMKDILQKREELSEELKKLREEYKNSLEKMDRFQQNENKQLREKAEKIKKLMDELLDEETRKLYEELEKLLEEQRDTDQMRDKLSKLNKKEQNLEKELERAFELLKRWKLEQKIDESLKELEKQQTSQEELAEKTEKEGTESKEELIEEQEELQEEFKKLQEEIEEIEELNQDLKQPESLPDTQEEEEEIEKAQEESKEDLQENKPKQAGEKQKKAAGQMKKMEEKMQQMQSNMTMESMMEDIDDLRAIMQNLLTLSFDQEKLIEEFREVQQSDPRFVSLGQDQLKIRDDAKIVEDSLLSLAGRVFQIESFVTREVAEMNTHLDNGMDGIRERKKQEAMVSQQFAMTSINNLALLLDDVLQQMQNAMAESMGKGKKGKPNQMPSLSQQQEMLNQQIEELQKGNKQGRELSEELAKLAAEQERLRNAFEEMQKMIDQEKGGQKPGEGIPEKMEETEMDLVNKRLTQETIDRQREILTRMLEAEDALRERDMDEERKAETAKEYDKLRPKAFEDYFKMKEQEIELLRTVPPKLFPYYKKEVSEYFKRLGEQTDTP